MHRIILGALTILWVNNSQAATFSLKAVKINDAPVAPTNSVVVNPGDKIETEVYLSGWGAQLPAGLRLYEFQFDSLGMVSGDSGALRPLIYQGPIPQFNPCASNSDCAAANTTCVSGLCRGPACNSVADCSPPNNVCVGTCVFEDFGPDPGLPEYGYFIDLDRPNYVFPGVQVIAGIIRLIAPSYEYGATTFVAAERVQDSGLQKYLGSLVLLASDRFSDDGEACGTFTLGFRSHIDHTFISDGPFGTLVQPNLEPLSVAVACTPPGTCCDGITGACVDDSRAADCALPSQVFNEGANCAEQGCFSAAIPAASEWGLAVLTLSLFVGAKVFWGGNRKPRLG